jgi:transposase
MKPNSMARSTGYANGSTTSKSLLRDGTSRKGQLILYDVRSTYFEGRHCPLARFDHSRDERNGNPQIVFGLLTNAEGCPVAVEVFEGNTGDPTTVASPVSKLRDRFHLKQIVLVGDRDMLTSARIREDLQPQEGLQ